jgi:hypothetical protein
MTLSRKDFLELLDEENAKSIAAYIVEILDHDPDHFKLIDYDFDLSGGTMQNKATDLETANPNTWFKFDALNNTILRQIIDYMKNCEEEEIDAEIVSKFKWFRDTISISIESEYRDEFRNKLRSKIFKESIPAEIVPMDVFSIVSIEITPNDMPYDTISVKKMVDPESPTPESVSKDIFQGLAEGKTPEQIIAEKQALGDERFMNIVEIKVVKNRYEVELDIYVDFSLSPQ